MTTNTPPLSPTALCIRGMLADLPGVWDVRDDLHSYAILVNDSAVHWVNKMSGGWISCDQDRPTLPDDVMAVLASGLGFEHSPSRGFRHHDWRDAHRPVVPR